MAKGRKRSPAAVAVAKKARAKAETEFESMEEAAKHRRTKTARDRSNNLIFSSLRQTTDSSSARKAATPPLNRFGNRATHIVSKILNTYYRRGDSERRAQSKSDPRAPNKSFIRGSEASPHRSPDLFKEETMKNDIAKLYRKDVLPAAQTRRGSFSQYMYFMRGYHKLSGRGRTDSGHEATAMSATCRRKDVDGSSRSSYLTSALRFSARDRSVSTSNSNANRSQIRNGEAKKRDSPGKGPQIEKGKGSGCVTARQPSSQQKPKQGQRYKLPVKKVDDFILSYLKKGMTKGGRRNPAMPAQKGAAAS